MLWIGKVAYDDYQFKLSSTDAELLSKLVATIAANFRSQHSEWQYALMLNISLKKLNKVLKERHQTISYALLQTRLLNESLCLLKINPISVKMEAEYPGFEPKSFD